MKALVVLFVSLTWCCCSGYQILECGSDGKVELDEARPTILTCTGITDDNVKWDVLRTGGTNYTAANCTPPTMTCYARFAWFKAEITEHNTSTLTVRLGDRSSTTGKIRCGGSSVGSSSATCNLRIVHKADKLSNCSVTVNNRDWTVSASCEVDRMYASDDKYSCKWVVPKQHGNETIKGYLSKTSFTEDNKEYMRGTCMISGLPMPTADGIHNYSVVIEPGVGLLAGPSLKIKIPHKPTFSNCPDIITEGDDVTCICQPSSSSPPAVTSWYVGISNFIKTLQLTNVNSSMDGTKYTCTQYWGGGSVNFIVFTLRVASVKTTPSTTMVPTKTIPTTTHDVYTEGEDKSVGDNNNDDTTDTAVISTPSTTMVSTKTIPTTTYDVNTEGEDKSVGDNNKDDTTDTGLPIAIIAGGAGGGLVVIIIIVVVVVVVVKKRRGGSPTEQRKVDTADDDFEEHINDLYESSDARPYAGTSHLLSGHNASSARDTTEPSTVNEESETAFGYSTVGFSAPQATASAQQQNQILESDLYSSPDENGAQPPVAIATQATPKGADVYAVVNKPGTEKPHENTESQNDEYAVVDKARSEPTNGEGLETTFAAEGETEYGSGHVYSQVNKQSKQN